MTTFLTPYIYDIRYLITSKFQNLLISTKTETRYNLEHEMMMQEREREKKKEQSYAMRISGNVYAGNF